MEYYHYLYTDHTDESLEHAITKNNFNRTTDYKTYFKLFDPGEGEIIIDPRVLEALR